MTNAEKYKTAEERTIAFKRFCEKSQCYNCVLREQCNLNNTDVAFYWLDLEAEEEKPLPCPFCGMVCDFHHESGGIDSVVWNMKCRDPLCGYRSALKDTKDEAITEHNRVARAVMAAKEAK